MLNGRIIESYKYGLEEYDCAGFNRDGIDLLIEKKREEFRFEFNLYLEMGETYDN